MGTKDDAMEKRAICDQWNGQSNVKNGEAIEQEEAAFRGAVDVVSKASTM